MDFSIPKCKYILNKLATQESVSNLILAPAFSNYFLLYYLSSVKRCSAYFHLTYYMTEHKPWVVLLESSV